jgi:hypothetical protein
MIGSFIAEIRTLSRQPSPELEGLAARLWPILVAADSPFDAQAVADGPINPTIRTIIVEATRPLTHSAEMAILSTPRLYAALAIAFDDKGFKSAFRDYGARKGCEIAVGRALRQARELASGIAPVPSGKPAPAKPAPVKAAAVVKPAAVRPAGAAALASPGQPARQAAVVRAAPLGKLPAKPVKPAAAKAVAAVAPAAALAAAPASTPPPASKTLVPPKGRNVLLERLGFLSRFADQSIAAKVSGHIQTITVAEGLAVLADNSLEKFHASVIQGLAGSSARLVVILLDRAVRRGEIEIGVTLTVKLRMTAARLLTNLNANNSGYQLASELLRDPAVVEALNPGEKLRLRFLFARSALRSGRPAEAQSEYHRIFLDHPERPDAAMQYILSTFAANPGEASALAGALLDRNYDVSPSDRIFLGELCLRAGDRTRATSAFLSVAAGHSAKPEAYIGMANAALEAGDEASWFAYFQHYGRLMGLDIDALTGSARDLAPFRFAAPDYARTADHPRIAVVMTCFNAEATLELAVRSVLAQTLSNINLFIVDDVSSDGSLALAHRLAQQDPRIVVTANSVNRGTYSSKNSALRIADAEYVTLHDSDDWMHPRRLEMQLAGLEGNKACSISDWVRMSADGKIFVRRGGPYTHLNPASTFLRKSLMERIGYFDEVRTGADAEFLSRIRNQCGWSSVFDTGKCLAVGLHHEASLTTSGAAAFDEHRYSPVRLSYTESWLEWHLRQIEADGEVTLNHTDERPFTVPEAINV